MYLIWLKYIRLSQIDKRIFFIRIAGNKLKNYFTLLSLI